MNVLWRSRSPRSAVQVDHWGGPLWAVALGILIFANAPDVVAATLDQQAEWRLEDVDYLKLRDALGAGLPAGNGVLIAHVEAGEGEDALYLPAASFGQFTASTDPRGESINFIDESGAGGAGFSGHATTVVGPVFYGNTWSMAPAANTVSVFQSNDWLNNVLNMEGGTPDSISTHDFRVANFSWVGSFVVNEVPCPTCDTEALGRFDYLNDNNNITAVVGLNGGGPIPPLLSHSYNSITVGVASGTHSTGITESLYGPGRTKPEIVGPQERPGEGTVTPSTTVGMVSSAATLLHESGAGTDAAQAETMKAILLAGATKEEFPSWSNTTIQPLDATFGAGELNIYNSYLIQQGGQTAGTSIDNNPEQAPPVSIDGWDFRTIAEDDLSTSVVENSLHYNFVVPEGSTATELSIVLNWNAEVTDSNPSPGTFAPDVYLDDLDMILYDSSTGYKSELVNLSTSKVDNLEHIHQLNLGPGFYTLQVINHEDGGGNRDFGLAWRMETLFDVPTADFDEDNDVDGSDLLAWQRGFGLLTGATLAEGDADGDGDVDLDDRSLWEANAGPLPLAATFAPVPEVGSLILALIACVALWFLRVGRSRGLPLL